MLGVEFWYMGTEQILNFFMDVNITVSTQCLQHAGDYFFLRFYYF